ncbi:NUDIX domain-containing protein [bacterium]|nr:NUDIX domain-containing protein [bacterium]
MIIYPAIDLRNGRCVRLRQGDPDTETVFSDDPVQTARHWVSLGAQWLHVVNLDGAFSKHASSIAVNSRPSAMIQRLDAPDAELPAGQMPINYRCLKAIRQAVDVPIQFGGGLRTLEDIALAFEMGADRVVLGTIAVKDPEAVRSAVNRWGADRIMVGIDARNGKVAIHGWQDVSEIDPINLAHHMKCLGVRRIVYTDIERDGMLAGVNVEGAANLGDMTDLKLIVNGGVADLYDIRQLKRHEHYNIEGVIVGQALYTGAVALPEVIEAAGGPMFRRSAGLVPYRQGKDGIEVLLLWNNFCEQWQFPRGTVEEGESVLGCAKREFSLETGLPIAALHDDCVSTLHYVAHIRDYDVEREVIYYLAQVGPGEVTLGHDNHGEFYWAPIEEARLMLIDTSPEQMPALEAAVAYFSAE